MARRRGLGKYKVARMMPAAAHTAAETGEEPTEERGVIFGTPQNRKAIIIMSIAGFVLVGLVHFFMTRNDSDFSVPAVILTAVHGGLIGMLMGQLMFVYPDGVMVVSTLIAIAAFEGLYVFWRSGDVRGFEFDRNALTAMVGIFFWSGFVGFWGGFIFYITGHQKREHFQKRMTRLYEDDETDSAD